MLAEAFLICALAPSPAFMPGGRIPFTQAYRMLFRGAFNEGFLIWGQRALMVRSDQRMTVLNGTEDSLKGDILHAPFKDKVFSIVWINQALPRQGKFFPMVFEIARIIQPGGFLFVEYDKVLNELLELNNFMRMPFRYHEYNIYQLLPGFSDGKRVYRLEEKRLLSLLKTSA